MADGRMEQEGARARIERMRRSGQISSEQADRLMAGIAAHAVQPEMRGKRAERRKVNIAAALVVLMAAAILFLISNSGGPAGVQDVAATLNQPEAVGGMNKSLSIGIALFILVVVPVIIVAGSYNSLVNKEEAVLTSWAQVESQFQRRADLVPALVETVTRYLQHERETLTEVTAQRQPGLDALAEAVDRLSRDQQTVAQALGDEEGIVENQQRMDQLAGGGAAVGETIARLFLVAEDYPTLASSDQFLELQAQLEGTENRINVARLRFNEAVGSFNSASRRIPGNLAAALGGFQRKAYFRSEEGSEDAPESLFE